MTQINETEPATLSLPVYRSHKQVRAARITEIQTLDTGTAILTLGMPWPVPQPAPGVDLVIYLPVTSAYMQKHQPQVGGYYVLYADGYESWSPAEAFEEGYTLAPPPGAVAQFAAHLPKLAQEDEQRMRKALETIAGSGEVSAYIARAALTHVLAPRAPVEACAECQPDGTCDHHASDALPAEPARP